MGLFPGYLYCIDTSALVDLNKYYPRDFLPTLWENIEKLISQGRIIAPHEVLNELKQYYDKNDYLLKLEEKYRGFFKNLDNSQWQLARQISNKYPGLIDKNKQTPDADPFVISLAISEGCSVITQESQRKPNKIPYVCKEYGIDCLSLLEFFKKQGWKF